jgi:hypothetical protein
LEIRVSVDMLFVFVRRAYWDVEILQGCDQMGVLEGVERVIKNFFFIIDDD